MRRPRWIELSVGSTALVVSVVSEELLAACCIREGAAEPFQYITSFVSRRIIPAGESLTFLRPGGKLLSEATEAHPATVFPMTLWLDPQGPHTVHNLDERPVRLLRPELK